MTEQQPQNPSTRERDRPPDKVFLSDANPHYVARAETVVDLRARILFHALLCDYLVIGDAQSLNNPLLRSVVAHEAGGEASPTDLAALLAAGRIRIARRSTLGSLTALRDDHAGRNVEDVPSPAYAELLDTLTAGHVMTYSGDGVAASFKSNVVEMLADGASRRDGYGSDYTGTLGLARAWAEREEVLLYHEIRVWKNRQPGATPGERQALRTLERISGVAYQKALPDALGLDVAAPRTLLADSRDAASTSVIAEELLPPVLLVPFVVGRLPVDVVIRALEHPARASVVAQLDLLRQGVAFDPSALMAALQNFTDDLTHDAMEALRGAGDEAALRALRTGEMRARIRLDTVADGTAPRARLDVIDVRDRSLAVNTLKLLTMPAAGFDNQPLAPTADGAADLDPEDRLVMNAS